MPWGVTGQWSFNFELDGASEYLELENIRSFTMSEEAGNNIPLFEACFFFNDAKALSAFQEGKKCFVEVGVDDGLIGGPFVIQRVQKSMTSDRKVVVVKGMYDAVKYIAESKEMVHPKSKSIDVIRKEASKYFKFKTNITSTNDSMNWMQPNTVNKEFINDVWMHSILPGSYMTIGISCDGIFMAKDVRKTLREDYEWKFILPPTGEREIPFDTDYLYDSQGGFMHYMAGKNKQVHKMENGLGELLDLFGSWGESFSGFLDAAKRFGGMAPQGENVHDKFQEAQSNNMTMLSMLSATRLELGYSSLFHPVRVLDAVFFKDPAIANGTTDDSISGMYIVNKVTRSLQHNRLETFIQMCREASKASK